MVRPSNKETAKVSDVAFTSLTRSSVCTAVEVLMPFGNQKGLSFNHNIPNPVQ
jgi:hypothetical protein